MGFGDILYILEVLGDILVILWVLGVFWSFFEFLRYFDHFLGFGGILVIFRVSKVMIHRKSVDRTLWASMV